MGRFGECFLLRFQRNNGILVVTPNDVAHVMSVATGIKMGKLSQDEVTRVLRLAEVLNTVRSSEKLDK